MSPSQNLQYTTSEPSAQSEVWRRSLAEGTEKYDKEPKERKACQMPSQLTRSSANGWMRKASTCKTGKGVNYEVKGTAQEYRGKIRKAQRRAQPAELTTGKRTPRQYDTSYHSFLKYMNKFLSNSWKFYTLPLSLWSMLLLNFILISYIFMLQSLIDHSAQSLQQKTCMISIATKLHRRFHSLGYLGEFNEHKTNMSSKSLS